MTSDLGQRLRLALERGLAITGLVVVNAQINPAGGAVYRHKQIAMLRFIGHLGQVFDVNVDKTRLVVFEGFEGFFSRCGSGLWMDLITHDLAPCSRVIKSISVSLAVKSGSLLFGI